MPKAPAGPVTVWPDNPSFTEKELAALAQVSLRFLQILRKVGKISYSKVGDHVHYTRADWEEYLHSVRRTATGRPRT